MILHGKVFLKFIYSSTFSVFMVTFSLTYVFVKVSTAVKIYYDHDNSYKGKHSVKAYSFIALVYYHVRKHGSTQADLVHRSSSEFCIRILRKKGGKDTPGLACAFEKSKFSPVMHFL